MNDAQLDAQTSVLTGRFMSSADAASRDDERSQPFEPVASRHEKAPQGNLRRFSEMERAKRLERAGHNLEVLEANSICEIAKLSDSQIAALESHQPKSDASTSLVETGKDMGGLATHTTEISPDLREVVTAWLDLNPAIKNAILLIVRSSVPAPTSLTSSAPGESISMSVTSTGHRLCVPPNHG
jgi:hypothetical protein